MSNQIINDAENKALAFTIEQNDFANMILNFLGKREELEYMDSKNIFKISHNDLEQFYYLLKEKIEKESLSTITHFSLTIFYHDKTKKVIHGIESLNHFLETRNVTPVKILLSWNIILTFPTNNTIENQKIDIEYALNNDYNNRYIDYPFIERNHHNTYCFIKIDYTNPVWGNEVLNLFKEHHQSLIIEEEESLIISRKFLKKMTSEYIILYFFLGIFLLAGFFFASSLKIIDISDNSLTSPQVETVKKIRKISNEDKDNLDFLSTLTLIKDENTKEIEIIKNKEVKHILKTQIIENKKISTLKNRKILSVLGIIFGSYLIIFLLLKHNIKYYSKKSFILITTRAEKEYDIYNNSKNKLVHYSLAFLTISIIIGLVVNVLSNFMI